MPHRPHARPLRPEELDHLALDYAPPEVRDWVAECEQYMGKRLERNDVVPFDSHLPVPPPELYEDMGVCRRSDVGEFNAEEFTLEQRIPMRVDVFRKPQPPRVQENMGLHLEHLREVCCFRNSRAGGHYAHILLCLHMRSIWRSSDSVTQRGMWQVRASNDCHCRRYGGTSSATAKLSAVSGRRCLWLSCSNMAVRLSGLGK